MLFAVRRHCCRRTITIGETMKKQEKTEKRILGRRLARELSREELEMAVGGTTSCSNCVADDCDEYQQI
jgi:hypothetical protein